jgi:hypothetical protein
MSQPANAASRGNQLAPGGLDARLEPNHQTPGYRLVDSQALLTAIQAGTFFHHAQDHPDRQQP